MSKRALLIIIITALLIVSGCSPAEQDAGENEGDFTPTQPLPTASPFALPATLAPVTQPSQVEGTSAAPTPLPAPTQISVATDVPASDEEETQVPSSSTANKGLTMSPQLGGPGDIVMVTGVGFAAGEMVSLHWAPTDGATGPVYWELEADANGRIEVGLIIPPADKWPRQPLEERDLIQLRAKSPSLGNAYLWINFTYIPPVNAVTSLVLLYENKEYGYQLMVPNLWKWGWTDDDESDVRFQSPDSTGTGFAIVLNGSDETAVIPGIMASEFPGESYTTAPVSVGSYPGSEATTGDGQVVQFIPSGGKIYVISFTDINGNPAYNILSTFTLTD